MRWTAEPAARSHVTDRIETIGEKARSPARTRPAAATGTRCRVRSRAASSPCGSTSSSAGVITAGSYARAAAAIVCAVVSCGSTSPASSARAVAASSNSRTGRYAVSSQLTFRWRLERLASVRAAVPCRCPCTLTAPAGSSSSGSCVSSSGDQQILLRRADQRRVDGLEAVVLRCRPEWLEVVIPRDQDLRSGQRAQHLVEGRDPWPDGDVPQTDDQLVFADPLSPRRKQCSPHRRRIAERPPAGRNDRPVVQVQVRPDPALRSLLGAQAAALAAVHPVQHRHDLTLLDVSRHQTADELPPIGGVELGRRHWPNASGRPRCWVTERQACSRRKWSNVA